jgi:flagellar protein FliS
MAEAMNPYQQYKDQSVQYASPGELISMLFNGCVKYIRWGMEAICREDIEKAHTNIIRAQDIIRELILSLNMDYDISEGLMALYAYMHSKLVQANINKDQEILIEVLEMVTVLRDAWEEALKQNQAPVQSVEEG